MLCYVDAKAHQQHSHHLNIVKRANDDEPDRLANVQEFESMVRICAKTKEQVSVELAELDENRRQERLRLNDQMVVDENNRPRSPSIEERENSTPTRRGPGRPQKEIIPVSGSKEVGRPRKVSATPAGPKRGRERPSKNPPNPPLVASKSGRVYVRSSRLSPISG